MQSANAEPAAKPTRHSEGARPHERAEESRAQRLTAVVYPEHGTGRAAKLTTCRHCGGKPLIARKCGRRSCAVCQKCGFHHRIRIH